MIGSNVQFSCKLWFYQTTLCALGLIFTFFQLSDLSTFYQLEGTADGHALASEGLIRLHKSLLIVRSFLEGADRVIQYWQKKVEQ